MTQTIMAHSPPPVPTTNLFLESEELGRLPFQSYSHSVEMAITRDRRHQNARITGRSQHGEIKLTRWVDGGTPKMYLAVSSGEPFPSLRLVLNRPPPPPIHDVDDQEPGTEISPTPFFVFALEDVIVTSVLTSVEAGGRPVETTTLDYAAIRWRYEAGEHPVDTYWDSRSPT